MYPEQKSAMDIVDAFVKMENRGVELQKLNTLQSLQDVLDNAKRKRHYSYVISDQIGCYDFYLNGEFWSTMKMTGQNMAEYMLEILEAGFRDGVIFSATEIFRALK